MEKKNPHKTIEDVEKFVGYQKKLLELEKDEELMETAENLKKFPAKTLEKKGLCVRKIGIVEKYTGLYGKYICEFQKKSKKDNVKSEFKSYKFGNGDIVGLFEFDLYVSEKALFTGIVYELNENKLSVAFDEFIEESLLPQNLCLVQMFNQVTFNRTNFALDKLVEENSRASNKLVNILFSKEKPEFDDELFTKLSTIEYFNKNLNETQKEAIRYSLASKDLSIIHGPPGTGKTTTVVEFILQSKPFCNKILAVAPSNIALDNIAEKLLSFKENGLKICRIGHPARLLESVLKISLDYQVKQSNANRIILETKEEIEKINRKLNSKVKMGKDEKFKTIGELKNLRKDIRKYQKKAVFEILSRSDVILTTCVGADDKWLKKCMLEWNNKMFDLVVIDECAQATESCCWIPVLMGRKLVLAGDHLQLPPTIKSKSAEEGLSYTLFDRMMNTYTHVSRMLKIQYRMNEKIMNFSSDQLYSGELKADNSVKDHLLNDMLKKEEIHDHLEITARCLLLVNTYPYGLHECLDSESDSKFNIGEVKIVEKFVDYLKHTLFLNQSDIGIITPYSAQVSALKQNLRERNNEIEISTVDGFQGREKEVIILSLVRSNKIKEVGFLAEKRRLNVAITRAKRMLIVICDVNTVTNDKFISDLISYLKDNNGEYPLTNIIDYGEIQDIAVLASQVSGQNEEKIKKNAIEKKQKQENKKGKKKKKGNNEENKENKEYKAVEIPQNRENFHFDQALNKNTEKLNKIKDSIQKFLNSNESSMTVKELNNSERRELHEFCETLGLNHISKGENDDRYLLITKNLKSKNDKINKIEQKVEEDDILIETVKPKIEVNENIRDILIQTNSIRNKQSNNIVEEKKTIEKQTEIKSSKPQKIKNKKDKEKKVESEEDDLDKFLDKLNEANKKCHFPNCLLSENKELNNCSKCNEKFCLTHYGFLDHNCQIYNNTTEHKDLLSGYRDKIVKKEIQGKINELIKDRQKKPKPKKK